MASCAGEALTAALSERFKFYESDVIPRRTRARLVCEVYPHPALVSLFGLDRILKYKRGRGRTFEERWSEFGALSKASAQTAQSRPASAQDEAATQKHRSVRPTRVCFAGLRGHTRCDNLRVYRLVSMEARAEKSNAIRFA